MVDTFRVSQVSSCDDYEKTVYFFLCKHCDFALRCGGIGLHTGSCSSDAPRAVPPAVLCRWGTAAAGRRLAGSLVQTPRGVGDARPLLAFLSAGDVGGCQHRLCICSGELRSFPPLFFCASSELHSWNRAHWVLVGYLFLQWVPGLRFLSVSQHVRPVSVGMLVCPQRPPLCPHRAWHRDRPRLTEEACVCPLPLRSFRKAFVGDWQ